MLKSIFFGISLSLAFIVSPAQAGLAPVGMLKFCDQHANQCIASNPTVIALTQDNINALNYVNKRINRLIISHADTGEDTWSLNPSKGDCEDYVLSKRVALVKIGFPAGALLIAVGTIKTGEQHAVLIVITDNGKLVLNNLTNEIKSIGSSDFRIRSISTSNPLIWNWNF